jgi:hypothetical protein
MKKNKEFISYTNNSSNRVDSFINVFLNNPINDHGFFSIPFIKTDTNNSSVLLLGDSFTFGHNSNPGQSFSDLLLKDGFVVFNTGISGADPLQYLLVAQKYVPILKPDYVVLNFFMGNDIMRYEREAGAEKPIMYNTLTNKLNSNIYGEFLSSPREVIEHIIFEFGIPPTSLLNKIFATTATTSLVWRALGLRYLQDTKTLDKYKKIKEKTFANLKDWNYTQDFLLEIKRLSEDNDAKFVLMIIPEVRNLQIVPLDNYDILWGIDYEIPEGLSIKDYVFNNGHYNDSGHRKHYEAIIKNLNKQ